MNRHMHKAMPVFLAGITLLLTTAAQGEYTRLSLDEKVRQAELIVIAKPTELSQRSPFSTAASKAVIQVEEVIKGVKPEGDLVVGYRSGDEVYDVYDRDRVRLVAEILEIGKPAIFFLRPAVTGVYATVNWQHGIMPIDDEKMVDPRWCGDGVTMLYRYNIKEGKKAPEHDPAKFRGIIRADEGLGYIREAVRLAESQQELGRMTINAAPTTVYWEKGESANRLLLRLPRREDCPPFDVTRVSAVVQPRSGEAVRAEGPCTLEVAPLSVDPVGSTDQLALAFSKKLQAADLTSVELVIDGQKRTFCFHEGSDCKSDSITVRCPACRSADTRPYRGIPTSYFGRPCVVTPDPLPEPQFEERENISHHCNTCLFQW